MKKVVPQVDQEEIEPLVDTENQSFEEQFRIVYDKFHKKVLNYIAKSIGNREDATDILQDVFLLFYNKLPKLDLNTGRFEAWLLRVARNMIMTHNRKRERKNAKSMPLGDYIAAAETEDEVEKKELHAKLDEFLNTLTERERTIFVLHKMEGVKYKDLMKIFDLSERTIKRIIRSVLDKLKSHNLFELLES